MSILPVIVRELRTQARQPLTYWLRIAGGVSVAVATALAFWAIGGFEQQAMGPGAFSNTIQTFGITLFGRMNLFMFAVIWLFVPLATADAISRERREGTLVLLYLTELRSFGIVVGKAFVHLLRAMTLFLTMAPWLMLPVIFGGIGVSDIGMALLLNFSAVLLAQAAGLLASTIPRDWLKSVLLAELFAVVLLLVMLHGHGAAVKHALRVGAPTGLKPGTPGFWASSFANIYYELQGGWGEGGGLIARTRGLIEFTTNARFEKEYRGWYPRGVVSMSSSWQRFYASLTPAGRRAWFVGAAWLLVGASLALVCATLAGAWRVKSSWQDLPAPLLDAELRQKYLAPRFGVAALNRSLSRALTANPIGWLQIYSPAARIVKWGWCLLFILVEILFSFNSDDLYDAQAGLGLALLLGLTFSATGSFRQELETGAFELLLVTPLRERQIILGRARGLWRQFLPAILVLGAGSIYLASGWHGQNLAQDAWLGLARTLAGFCALPLIGLFFSVLRWNFFAAWMGACLLGLLPPVLGRALGASDAAMIALQLVLALIAALLLQERLRSRRFLQR